MTLVDSSVWIEHIRRADPDLLALMDAEQVLMHPFVLGELSLGQCPGRDAMLRQLSVLEAAPLSPESEVAGLVQGFRLRGRGIGWVDCHLLASARTAHARLMTRDKALKAAWAFVGKH